MISLWYNMSMKSRFRVGYVSTDGSIIIDGPRMILSKTGKTTSKKWLVECSGCGAQNWQFSSSIDRKKHPCKRCYDKSMRRTDSYPAAMKAFMSAKGGASRRKLQWDFSIDDYVAIAARPCFYCGENQHEVLPYKSWQQSMKINGLDRVDNSLGYTKENVVACCGHCNWAKKDLTQEEFLSWVKRVYENGENR